jgi:hypothetical protein
LSAHLVFDLLAAASALAVTVLVYFWQLRERSEAALASAGPGYVLAPAGGAEHPPYFTRASSTG